MNTRTYIQSYPQGQSTKGRLVKRKVQKLGHKKIEVAKQSFSSDRQTSRTHLKVIPPQNPSAIPTKRPRVSAPAIKQHTTPSQGRIPPYNPNAVQSKTVRGRKQPTPYLKQTSRSRRTRLKPMARMILYVLRLLVVGVGIGAIVGTVLSVLDPAARIATSEGGLPNTTMRQEQSQATPTPREVASSLYLSQEIIPLKSTVQNLAITNPNLIPGVFLVDLDNGNYVDVNGSSSFSAASTIKIPILVAFFQDVDAQKIRLDETLTLQKEMVAGGSGDMQYKAVGTQFTALEVATKMMTISDNTATNMLIAQLGGIEALNQRFRSWGLTTTMIRNSLPDLEGTNTTSPKELSNLMVMVGKGSLVSMPSRDRILDIMRRTVRNHLLPTGLGQGATIAHKTGNIGTVLADAGLVDMPIGKRYVISVMVQRPNNDPRAEKLISSISRAAYQQFSAVPIPSTTGGIPTTTYQPPVMTQPLPNGMGSTVPTTGYQPPMMTQPLPNGMGSTVPTTGYQSPVMVPQMAPQIAPQYYYPPYQR